MQLHTLKFLSYVPVCMPVRQYLMAMVRTMYCQSGPTYGMYNRKFRVNKSTSIDKSLIEVKKELDISPHSGEAASGEI